MSTVPPADPAAFSPEELAAARDAMQAALATDPKLNDFGFGVFNSKLRGEERAAEIARNREALLEPRSLAEFLAARRWLSQLGKIKSLNRCGTSYGLKHLAEREIGYVTNGCFICAAIAEGIRVERCSYDSPNAWFNLSSSAWLGAAGSS